MDELSSEESSLSDLFGDDSQDEFILPTTEESNDGFSLYPNKKRKLLRTYGERKKMRNSSLQIPEQDKDEPDNAMLPYAQDILPINESHPVNEDGDNTNVLETPKKKPRKVVANPAKWKSNIRKKKHQAGENYISRRGKNVPAKTVKNLKDCLNCKFKCSSRISNSERIELNTSYYSLSSTEKRHFLVATSERSLTARPKRTNTNPDYDIDEDRPNEDRPNEYQPNDAQPNEDGFNENRAREDQDKDQLDGDQRQIRSSKRTHSFRYFFTVKGERIQVCKSFYLGTLNISQKPIYNVHQSKNPETNTPQSDKRGKSVSSRRTASGDVEFAVEHIERFPKIESHYCRAKTKREYLGSNLNVTKMYDLYLEKCKEASISPVKLSMYRHIFMTKFNLGFQQPKSDRCDTCEKYKMAEKTETLSADLISEYNYHIDNKIAMREESKRDKENDNPVLLFDLENVITCPRATISSFFYTRKLNVYNMTAYFSLNDQVYCAIWDETLAGRAGNDIASAVRKILDVLADENDLTTLVTWSDSCVPQNRNSIMSYAVMDFLKENRQVQSITMKYSVPGHSCVQMVDNAHSIIERAMQNSEFYSPIGLVRILKGAKPKRPFRIIQMKESDFKDFASIAKMINYKNVPFSKVACLKFSQTYHEVEFKSSHMAFEPMNLANLKSTEKKGEANRKCKTSKPANDKRASSIFESKPKTDKKKQEISELKKKDIQNMFPYMPIQDRDYFKAILKIGRN